MISFYMEFHLHQLFLFAFVYEGPLLSCIKLPSLLVLDRTGPWSDLYGAPELCLRQGSCSAAAVDTGDHVL